MKKIALIVSNNLWSCPYVLIYSKLLDKWGITYDIISWNRCGQKEECIQFNLLEKSRNPIALLWSFWRFSKFVQKIVKRNDYKRLVVFDSQLGIFLSSFLNKKFKGKYVFDYRDLSIEQNPFFKNKFIRLLSNSCLNIISSPGFKRYLPSTFDYIVCHNINIDLAIKSLRDDVEKYSGEKIRILTIGAIRVDSNYEVIDAIGNKADLFLSFVGRGPASIELEKYVNHKGFGNISFSGFYKKEEEPSIYKNHAFVNIIYPLIPSHISALSNRFYNSIIYRRPMLVRSGTIQGDYAKRYKVGLVINDCDNLPNFILDYNKQLNYDEYSNRCKELLESFVKDNLKFESLFNQFATE